jgi:hypothetical protein
MPSPPMASRWRAERDARGGRPVLGRLEGNIIIITRTTHSEALILRGTGYNDNLDARGGRQRAQAQGGEGGAGGGQQLAMCGEGIFTLPRLFGIWRSTTNEFGERGIYGIQSVYVTRGAWFAALSPAAPIRAPPPTGRHGHGPLSSSRADLWGSRAEEAVQDLPLGHHLLPATQRHRRHGRGRRQAVLGETSPISKDILVLDFEILSCAPWIFPEADQCKRRDGAAPGSHRVLGDAVLSNKICTMYFLKLP